MGSLNKKKMNIVKNIESSVVDSAICTVASIGIDKFYNRFAFDPKISALVFGSELLSTSATDVAAPLIIGNGIVNSVDQQYLKPIMSGLLYVAGAKLLNMDGRSVIAEFLQQVGSSAIAEYSSPVVKSTLAKY